MRTVKFDAIRIGELSVNFMTPPVSLSAKAAFVCTKTGATHGWTHGGNWSKETIEKLHALRESMENDLASTHFEDAFGVTTYDGMPPVSGLGEHLGSVPQI